MKKYIIGWRKYIVFASISAIFSSGAFVVGGYMLGLLTESALNGNLQMMVILALLVIATYFVSFVFNMLGIHFKLKSSAGIVSGLNIGFLRSLYKSTINRFRKKDDAYYINMSINDSSVLFEDRYYAIASEIGFAVQAAVALSLLAFISFWMFAISLTFVVLPIISTRIFSKIIQERRMQVSKAKEGYTSVVTEAMQGFENIKHNRPTEKYFKRFENIVNNLYSKSKKDAFMQLLAYRVGFELTTFLNLAALLLGGYLVYAGQMSAGELLATTFMFSHVSDGIRNFFSTRTDRLGTNSIKEKFENELSYIDEDENLKSPPFSSTPQIKYNNVTFGFGENTKLYNNFSYEFNPGCSYVILGESGKGKSTLLKLLMKYYKDYEGSISLGGVDISEINEKEILNLIGVVSQDVLIINDTLKNNITLFDDINKDLTPILKSLSLTELSERVGDTPLGDFGDNISGGEKQRISIARVIYRQPKIIIFDEPTTGLDPENTKIINDYILSLNGVTRIVISHDWDEEYISRFDDVIRI